MKQIIAALALLFLAACIPVGDFGSYWAKGFVDSNLLGKWDEVQQSGSAKYGDAVKVSQNGSMYRIDSLDPAERAKKDYQPVDAKTLKAGKYLLLMTKDDNKKSGDLVRYIVKGDTFLEYTLDPKATGAFLKKHYPNAKNIEHPVCKKKCMFDEVRVKKFDDEVYKILSGIPDTKEYWTFAGKYRRHVEINN